LVTPKARCLNANELLRFSDVSVSNFRVSFRANVKYLDLTPFSGSDIQKAAAEPSRKEKRRTPAVNEDRLGAALSRAGELSGIRTRET
jgi:hypothetical protein